MNPYLLHNSSALMDFSRADMSSSHLEPHSPPSPISGVHYTPHADDHEDMCTPKYFVFNSQVRAHSASYLHHKESSTLEKETNTHLLSGLVQISAPKFMHTRQHLTQRDFYIHSHFESNSSYTATCLVDHLYNLHLLIYRIKREIFKNDHIFLCAFSSRLHILFLFWLLPLCVTRKSFPFTANSKSEHIFLYLTAADKKNMKYLIRSCFLHFVLQSLSEENAKCI